MEDYASYNAKVDSCQSTSDIDSGDKIYVDNIVYIQNYNAESLKKAISVGPTIVHVQHSETVFRQYEGGIMNSKDCGTNTDHVVAAVGYGKENG